MNAKILDPQIYENAKQIVYAQYKVPSAYRSGALVKKYKEMGGRYSGDKTKTPLKRWFAEEWKDIGNQTYAVYRPTKKVSKLTPLTQQQIDPTNLKAQINLKQKIKSKSNLPPFKPK